MKSISSFSTLIRFTMLLSCGIFISVQLGIAQVVSRDEHEILAPQTWSFVKYGNTPVDLYTGTVSVNIPIYTYKDLDFELPISIGYGSDGYKPNNQAGILGLGWYLNAGGVVTREVRGIPDEWKEFNIPIPLEVIKEPRVDGAGVVLNGFHALHMDTTIISSDNYTLDILYDHVYAGSALKGYPSFYDPEPDMYRFNFMGLSGSFFRGINKGHVPVFHTNITQEDIKVEFGSDYYCGPILTSGDGFEYAFYSNWDKEVIEMSDNYHDPDNGDYSSYPVAYHLKQIKAPNGRKIIFKYSGFDMWHIENKKPEASQRNVRRDTLQTGGGYRRRTQIVRPTLLQSIEIDGKVYITFDYEFREPEIDYENNPLIYQPRLCAIRVEKKEDIQRIEIKRCEFKYKYPPSAQSNKVLFLDTAIISGEGTYKMEYWDWDSVFPRNGSMGIDHWGYYNGRDSHPANFLPVYREDSLGNENIVNTNCSRDVSPWHDVNRKGLLKALYYPTGGRTEYIYEPHDYSWAVIRSFSTGYGPTLFSYENDIRCGGQRIAAIADYVSDNDKTGKVRHFKYKRSDGFSSGILAHYPQYYMDYYIQRDYNNRAWGLPFGAPISIIKHDNRNELSSQNKVIYATDDNHINYSRVIEIQPDGSSIVYEFTSHHEFVDAVSLVSEWDSQNTYMRSSDIERLFWIPSSKKHYRGRIKAISFLRNNDTIYQEKYDYHLLLDVYATKLHGLGKFYDHQIFISNCPVNRLVKTHFFDNEEIQEITNYKYANNRDRLRETRIIDSKGNTLSTNYIYVADKFDSPGTYGIPTRIDSLRKERNIINQPLRVDEKRGETVSRKTFTFDQFGGGLLKQLEIQTANVIGAVTEADIENALENEISFDHYDALGNILQITRKDGTGIVYIWGYDGLHPVAKIENATLSQVQEQHLKLNDIHISPLSLNLSLDAEEAIRSIPGAMVTTYEHEPLVGITKITDASGRVSRYEYDKEGKLMTISDDKDYLLESYQYNIKTQ